jgi:hypothetical protein
MEDKMNECVITKKFNCPYKVINGRRCSCCKIPDIEFKKIIEKWEGMKTGQYFEATDGGVFVLSLVEQVEVKEEYIYKVTLIGVSPSVAGRRWQEPVEVENPGDITEEEMKRITGRWVFKRIEEWDRENIAWHFTDKTPDLDRDNF